MSHKRPYTYLTYKEQILERTQKLGWNVQPLSPYAEYPELQTLILTNPKAGSSGTLAMQISGTHGVEGAAGAEIQLELLSEHSQELLGSNCGVALVFALNPFGFHFRRRTSIENIDLNRNTGNDLPQSHIIQDPHWLRPLWRSHSTVEQVRGLAQSLTLALFKGFGKVMRTFAEGQKLEPQGLFYSGQGTALEMQTFVEALRPLLKNKSRVSVIDLHTGLGPLFGELIFHCEGSPETSSAIFEGKVEIPGQTPQSYRGQGLVADRLTKEFSNIQWHGIVQEFGVKSTAESFLALLLENQYHWQNFGKMPDALYLKHPIKNLLFQTFFSSQELWQDWIRNKGCQRFMELLHFEQDGIKQQI